MVRSMPSAYNDPWPRNSVIWAARSGGYAPSCEQGKHSKDERCSNESCARVPFCKRQLSRWRRRRRRLTAMPLLLARLRGFVQHKPPTTTRADHSTTPAPSRTQADTRPPQSRTGGHGADNARPSAEGRGRQGLEPRGRPHPKNTILHPLDACPMSGYLWDKAVCRSTENHGKNTPLIGDPNFQLWDSGSPAPTPPA